MAPLVKTGVHRHNPESDSSYGICFPIPCSQGEQNVLDDFSTSPSPRPVRSQKRQNAQGNRLETCRTCQHCSPNPIVPFRAHTQGSEEPTVLSAGVTVLKGLLDGLLGILALGDLLESVVGDGTLETLELESVASRHQVVVVNHLDERLDTAAAVDELLAHTAGHLQRVALDTGDDGVREGVRLGASIVRLDDDDLFRGKNAQLAF